MDPAALGGRGRPPGKKVRNIGKKRQAVDVGNATSSTYSEGTGGEKRYRGVRARSSASGEIVWTAEIKDGERDLRIWLGTWRKAYYAARAYDAACRIINPKRSRPNFGPPVGKDAFEEPVKQLIDAAADRQRREQLRKAEQRKAEDELAAGACAMEQGAPYGSNLLAPAGKGGLGLVQPEFSSAQTYDGMAASMEVVLEPPTSAPTTPLKIEVQRGSKARHSDADVPYHVLRQKWAALSVEKVDGEKKQNQDVEHEGPKEDQEQEEEPSRQFALQGMENTTNWGGGSSAGQGTHWTLPSAGYIGGNRTPQSGHYQEAASTQQGGQVAPTVGSNVGGQQFEGHVGGAGHELELANKGIGEVAGCGMVGGLLAQAFGFGSPPGLFSKGMSEFVEKSVQAGTCGVRSDRAETVNQEESPCPISVIANFPCMFFGGKRQAQLPDGEASSVSMAATNVSDVRPLTTREAAHSDAQDAQYPQLHLQEPAPVTSSPDWSQKFDQICGGVEMDVEKWNNQFSTGQVPQQVYDSLAPEPVQNTFQQGFLLSPQDHNLANYSSNTHHLTPITFPAMAGSDLQNLQSNLSGYPAVVANQTLPVQALPQNSQLDVGEGSAEVARPSLLQRQESQAAPSGGISAQILMPPVGPPLLWESSATPSPQPAEHDMGISACMNKHVLDLAPMVPANQQLPLQLQGQVPGRVDLELREGQESVQKIGNMMEDLILNRGAQAAWHSSQLEEAGRAQSIPIQPDGYPDNLPFFSADLVRSVSEPSFSHLFSKGESPNSVIADTLSLDFGVDSMLSDEFADIGTTIAEADDKTASDLQNGRGDVEFALLFGSSMDNHPSIPNKPTSAREQESAMDSDMFPAWHHFDLPSPYDNQLYDILSDSTMPA